MKSTFDKQSISLPHSTATGLSTLGITTQRTRSQQAELVPNWCKDDAFVLNLGAE